MDINLCICAAIGRCRLFLLLVFLLGHDMLLAVFLLACVQRGPNGGSKRDSLNSRQSRERDSCGLRLSCRAPHLIRAPLLSSFCVPWTRLNAVPFNLTQFIRIKEQAAPSANLMAHLIDWTLALSLSLSSSPPAPASCLAC